MKFFILLFTTVLFISCSSKKKDNHLYGLWQDSPPNDTHQPYTVLFIDKFGQGVKISSINYTGDGTDSKGSVVSGVFENGIVKLDQNNELGATNIVVNGNKLLIGGKEYSEVMSWDELSVPSTTKEFAKNIVEIIKTRHPEIFRHLYVNDENANAFRDKCPAVVEKTDNWSKAVMDYAIRDTRNSKIKLESLKYVSYKTKPLDDETIKNIGLCVDYLTEFGILQIACDMDGTPFFILVPFYGKTKEGKYIMLGSPQVAEDGMPFKDQIN